MNSKQFNLIKKYVKQNNGATLTSAGGFAVLKRGFMVSLKGSETKTTADGLTKRLLKQYTKLASERGAFIGLWLDGDTLYVDVSVNVAKRETALTLAKQNEQLAIYDVLNNTSIYLK